jgi:hypothetical protein
MQSPNPHLSSRLRVLAAIALMLSSAALAGCTPKVGDHCVLNTDCGSSGVLVCDDSLPNGYCTQFNCTPDVCQNSAACVAFEPSVPGCPYDDYHSPARTTQTFCMAQCHSDSDCRQSDGYICADPRQPPWNAAIIDDDQAQLVCIPGYSSSSSLLPNTDSGLPEGSVCSTSGPVLDAATPSGDDAASDGGDAGDAGEAGNPVDAASDASDASGSDGAPDAPEGDAGADGPGDASADGGSVDGADAGAFDAQDEG